MKHGVVQLCERGRRFGSLRVVAVDGHQEEGGREVAIAALVAMSQNALKVRGDVLGTPQLTRVSNPSEFDLGSATRELY